MPTIQSCPVSDLKLDLHNYRTVPQKSEEKSVHALISIDPEYFWALTESLLEDGWHGTENVLVLENGADKIVKEGNRRIGAIKLILGNFKLVNFTIPAELKTKIETATPVWKKGIAEVPCNVFSKSERDKVEKLVALTHAKGEKAGRLKWNAVAKARYNRDETGHSEAGLNLLEKYLKSGKNIDATQKELWGGEYPLTVLDEALKKLAPRIGLADSRVASDEYSKTSKYVSQYEAMLHDIGVNGLKFTDIRDIEKDFLLKYGFPAPAPTPPAAGPTGAGPGAAGPGAGGPATGGGTGKGPSGKSGPKSIPLNDPRSVGRELRKFVPQGKNASKVVDLLVEARKLKLRNTPIAFCLIMRAMFEISVRDYCSKHSIPTVKMGTGGTTKDKKLAELLTEAGTHLSSASTDGTFKGIIKTAIFEVKSPNGTLSIPTMNAVVHSPTTIITEGHIIAGFHKIFPLLVALNK